MIIFRYLRPLLPLVLLAYHSEQVDIRIERTFLISGEAESFIAATCLDIPPGVCCKPPVSYPDATTKVLFRQLQTWDIAAVWRNDYIRNQRSSNRHITGCSGPPLASRLGSGRWLWRQPATDRRAAEGASFISLPRALPPDSKTGQWLVWEGLLTLSWRGGRGRWYADSAVEESMGRDSGINVGAKSRRDIHSVNTGNVVARPPPWARYPNFVEANGMQYNKSNDGVLLYASAAGEVLNLTDMFVP